MDDELDRYWNEYGDDEQETSRKPRKASRAQDLAELAEAPENADEFKTTYQPARFETGWLHSSLSPFYQQNLICDVLYHVKGGKEASVYCCKAHPATGVELLAAKVYRPRQFRNLRNDKMYREGRALLTADGTVAKRTDHRLMRAVGKKTEFGVQVQHTSWLMYEYTTLERLFREGAAVPHPVSAAENAILMGFQGDVQRAAPTLIEVAPETDEAESLFREALRNIELMLRLDVIHGDLSAYNMLYWEGKITLIDFPQVSSVETNSQARFILQRDITRTCEYFQRHGVNCDPAAILEDLWRRYAESRVQPMPTLQE
jgi:RIO kinase 1